MSKVFIADTQEINNGILESLGWEYSNTNFYRKDGLSMWYYNSWMLEIAPKSASEKATTLLYNVKTVGELNEAVAKYLQPSTPSGKESVEDEIKKEITIAFIVSQTTRKPNELIIKDLAARILRLTTAAKAATPDSREEGEGEKKRLIDLTLSELVEQSLAKGLVPIFRFPDKETIQYFNPAPPAPGKALTTMKTENETPRRIRMDLMNEAELAITKAMQEVEKMPADMRLTDAVIMLSNARNKVADFIDGVSIPVQEDAFTEEEVKIAKATRDEIISQDINTLKSIYMAGRICMWDKMRQSSPPTPPAQPEVEKAAADSREEGKIAVEFAGWILKSDYVITRDGHWADEYLTRRTTSALYTIFLTQKQKV